MSSKKKRKLATKISVDNKRINPNVCNNLHCGVVLREVSFDLRAGAAGNETRFKLCPHCFKTFMREETAKRQKPKIHRGLLKGL